MLLVLLVCGADWLWLVAALVLMFCYVFADCLLVGLVSGGFGYLGLRGWF